MTGDDFRQLALALPEVTEGSHMGHPDFRVDGKLFASLTEDERRATVRLPPESQAMLLRNEPAVASAAAGAWGQQGWTILQLASATSALVELALEEAWRHRASRQRLARHQRRPS